VLGNGIHIMCKRSWIGAQDKSYLPYPAIAGTRVGYPARSNPQKQLSNDHTKTLTNSEKKPLYYVF